ncbi:hypothetical protein IWX49DRAFT_257193 [Phyllosticta citricarpa]
MTKAPQPQHLATRPQRRGPIDTRLYRAGAPSLSGLTRCSALSQGLSKPTSDAPRPIAARLVVVARLVVQPITMSSLVAQAFRRSAVFVLTTPKPCLFGRCRDVARLPRDNLGRSADTPGRYPRPHPGVFEARGSQAVKKSCGQLFERGERLAECCFITSGNSKRFHSDVNSNFCPASFSCVFLNTACTYGRDGMASALTFHG